MSDGGNSLALSALCSFSAVHVAVKTRMLQLRGKNHERTWSGLSVEGSAARRSGPAFNNASSRKWPLARGFQCELAAVALLLAASVAAL